MADKAAQRRERLDRVTATIAAAGERGLSWAALEAAIQREFNITRRTAADDLNTVTAILRRARSVAGNVRITEQGARYVKGLVVVGGRQDVLPLEASS